MKSFIEQIRRTIASHKLLGVEDRVLVGVSGGADSVALLLILKELQYNLAVAHLNHGLRGDESDSDEKFVADLASKLGTRYFSRHVSIATQGGNVEAAGRVARKEFFHDLVREHGFTKIALAHNKEDRAETFLLHLMRGAGGDGLASMAPATGSTIRPLIETSRVEIEAYLCNQDQAWRNDQTNLDISFTRNRMRHATMPQLASLYNVRLVEALSRTVAVLQDENHWMRELAGAWIDVHSTNGSIDAQALRREPIALVRRVIRESLRREGSELTDTTFDHVEAVRALLDPGKSGKIVLLPGGLVATREFDRLNFLRSTESHTEFEYELPIPGAVYIPEIGQVFRAEYVTVESTENGRSAIQQDHPSRVFVDGSRLGPCVKIRNWKPGDYYKPTGWPSGKVKKLFQREKIPRSHRRLWPVLATESTIIWVAPFPVSRDFLPGGGTKKIVAFDALRD